MQIHNEVKGDLFNSQKTVSSDKFSDDIKNQTNLSDSFPSGGNFFFNDHNKKEKDETSVKTIDNHEIYKVGNPNIDIKRLFWVI